MQNKLEEESTWRRLCLAWASTLCPEAINQIPCTTEATSLINTTSTEVIPLILTTDQVLKPWMTTSTMLLRTQAKWLDALLPTEAVRKQRDPDNTEHTWTTSCRPLMVMKIYLLVRVSMRKCPTAKALSATTQWTNTATNCTTQRWLATCLRCRIKLHLTILFLMQKEADKEQPASMEPRGTTTKKATRAKRISEERADNTPPKKK